MQLEPVGVGPPPRVDFLGITDRGRLDFIGNQQRILASIRQSKLRGARLRV
jgi:hypothetical protein